MTKKLHNHNESPIGIFDSGIGGLSIWKEINNLLPNESTIYLADSKNAPYGEKSKKAILDFSIKNTEFLLQQHCKIIVVACNTATTNAIALLRENYAVPFIGIEPAIKPAALTTKTGKVGVLATKGTLNSDLFLTTSNRFKDNLEVIRVEGKGLVQLIEAGELTKTRTLLEQYLQPMIEKSIDNLVLGCTHYPFLIPIIKEIIPSTIQIIDSGKAVAKQTNKVLEDNQLLNKTVNNNSDLFYTNKDSVILNTFLNQLNVANYQSQQVNF